MKEIKRYSKPHKVWILSKLGQWCSSKDVAELEAVVETMQKRIEELERDNIKIIINSSKTIKVAEQILLNKQLLPNGYNIKTIWDLNRD